MDTVRQLVERDSRVTAALMYGSFTRGEGDQFSDVEFYVFMPRSTLVAFDREAWSVEVAPVRYSFVNEFGTFVVVFDTFIRGEFHFVPDDEIGTVSGWVFEKLEPERMVLKDRGGELRSALDEAATTSLWTSAADARREQSERLFNWLLLATNVYQRGEYARTLDALSYAHRFLLRGARLQEEKGTGSPKVQHWLNPARNLEGRASRTVVRRYGLCTASLNPVQLRSALAECWSWGAEQAQGLDTETLWRAAISGHPSVKELFGESSA